MIYRVHAHLWEAAELLHVASAPGETRHVQRVLDRLARVASLLFSLQRRRRSFPLWRAWRPLRHIGPVRPAVLVSAMPAPAFLRQTRLLRAPVSGIRAHVTRLHRSQVLEPHRKLRAHAPCPPPQALCGLPRHREERRMRIGQRVHGESPASIEKVSGLAVSHLPQLW
jgi:hypothetical protein